MLPPIPETPSDVPMLETALVPVIPIDTDPDAVAASVTETVAATPLPITVLFVPTARHRYPPVVFAQLSDLPAALKPEPATAEIEVTLPAGYVSNHCSAATGVPVVVRVSGSVAVEPGAAVVELRESADWPHNKGHTNKASAHTFPKLAIQRCLGGFLS